MAMLQEAETDLRDLLAVPDNYRILFLGGAARTHFSMVPLNLIASDTKKAAYICSGFWSQLAFQEGKRFCNAYALSEIDFDESKLKKNTAYVYYTPNETIEGVRFSGVPACPNTPLIADMTSCLLSEPIDVTQFGLIFAGAQKNIGPAGLSVVIIRDDLLKIKPQHTVPTMLDYRVHATNHSLYATPPVFQCDMAAKMFKWVKASGGVKALYAINQAKAAKLYAYIDASTHYVNHVKASQRSIMNVCFSMTDTAKEVAFLEAAEGCGLKGLKGHKRQGGLRASLYNAMPMAGVDALIECMDVFTQQL